MLTMPPRVEEKPPTPEYTRTSPPVAALVPAERAMFPATPPAAVAAPGGEARDMGNADIVVIVAARVG